ncbi:MAG: hypothetical protein JXR97_04240 [Planctomycetes bacterium]|nr:hypothetical protein [Planctomycetota bacterium]
MKNFFDKNTARALTGTHDLRLSNWGPYTKRYMGISHIPEVARGLRFDMSVFPALYRRKTCVPNIKFESDYHPWKAAPDLSYYVHRHDIIWKDQVYADVAYLRADDNTVYVQTTFVNNTGKPQNVALHYLASIHFPPVRAYTDQPIRMLRASLPKGAVWVDGLSYRHLSERPDDPKDGLVGDGHLRGEIHLHGMVNGTGIMLGPWNDDTATYRVKLKSGIKNAVALLRCKMTDAGGAAIRLGGKAIKISASDEFQIKRVSLGDLKAGAHDLELACTKGAVVIDGFAIVAKGEESKINFAPVEWDCVPKVEEGKNSLLIKYSDVKDTYGVAWTGDEYFVREFFGDDIDVSFRQNANNHVSKKLYGGGEGHYSNVYVRPVFLEPKSTIVLYGMVTNGSRKSVQKAFGAWPSALKKLPGRFAEEEKNASLPPVNPEGETYRFSQERMAAMTMTNIVYPVRTRGSYIRHYTPGRAWDCLYTWDSGFIGLGLLEMDMARSLDNLNAYLTDPGASGAAFIHHGSPVPVQFYQFLELWNKSQSREMAAFFYPRLRQYHHFLAGRNPVSRTRKLASNLVSTWDYFYNSGGWDDYPPQEHVHHEKLTRFVATSTNTSQAIRTAKILKMVASELGEPVEEYDEDIAIFTNALQTHAWDAKSGYFSYVLHDKAGKPCGHLRHESGKNFNMGLDGVSPLVAGICTPAQEMGLVEKLMSDRNLWSRCGLSTVDQSAPYFSDEGYWNGAVWMPHQWFIWKALLGLGYTGQAFRIAKTALDVWKNETEESYNCFEHFIVRTGRGAGWHHFSGLSAPVLNWFHAYYMPGRLNVGLDTHVASLDFGKGHTSMQAELHQYGSPDHSPAVIAVMKPGKSYSVTFGGEKCEYSQNAHGALEIRLPRGDMSGVLEIG